MTKGKHLAQVAQLQHLQATVSLSVSYGKQLMTAPVLASLRQFSLPHGDLAL